MAFLDPSTEAPLQCITMHRQLPKNVGNARLNVSSDRFTEKILEQDIAAQLTRMDHI